MKKRIVLLLVGVLLMNAMVFSAGAAPQVLQETEIIHTEIGDIEKISVLTIYNTGRSSVKSASRVNTYTYGGKTIAEVTLSASFSYDGTTAQAVSASGSHTTYDGWSYLSERITKSGGTATLTATLFKLGSATVPVNITLTCSPTGQIS